MLAPVVRLVDDDARLREAQAFVLQLAGFSVDQYESAEDFLARNDINRPGCIILDVRMNGMSGLQCQAEMIKRGWDFPILFLTGHGDINMALMALKKGAADFLQKPVQAEVLVDACRKLVDWHIGHWEKKEKLSQIKQRIDSLSPRESEVAHWVSEGLSNKAIANMLSISEQAVKIHRSNVYKKLEVHTAVEIRQLLVATKAQTDKDDDTLLTLLVLPENKEESRE